VRLIVCLILAIIMTTSAAASNCAGGGTTIFFGNGILTTRDHAQTSMYELEALLEMSLQSAAPNRDSSCTQYKLAWDSEFVNSSNGLATVPNAIQQLSVALAQWIGGTWSSVWADLFQYSVTTPGVDDSFNNSPVTSDYSKIVKSIVNASQPDVQNHLALYKSELQAGNNVIVVTHSQGNFYINEVYPQLSVPADKYFTVVGVATPANEVAGNGNYVTLHNDIIKLVPTSLSANTVNATPTDRCAPFPNLASMGRCHDFVNSYLAGNVSGYPSIISPIVAVILQPVAVLPVGTGSGTVLSSPLGIDCSGSANCTAQFYVGQSVTLTATASTGSVFAGWSGACSGSNLTTTVTVAPTGVECTADFEQQMPLSVTFVATGEPIYYQGTYNKAFPYSYTSTSTTSWSAGMPNFIESSGTFGATSASAHYQGWSSCEDNGLIGYDGVNNELLTISTKGPAGAIYHATITVSVTLTNNILTAGFGSSMAVTQNEMYPIRIDGGGTIYNTVQSLPFSMTDTQAVSILAFSSYEVSSGSTAACVDSGFPFSFTSNATFDITVQVNVTN
jgi:hypothetical protein